MSEGYDDTSTLATKPTEYAFPSYSPMQGHYKGVTLRDYMAAKAIQGMCADPAYMPPTAREIAVMGYLMADCAMVVRSMSVEEVKAEADEYVAAAQNREALTRMHNRRPGPAPDEGPTGWTIGLSPEEIVRRARLRDIGMPFWWLHTPGPEGDV